MLAIGLKTTWPGLISCAPPSADMASRPSEKKMARSTLFGGLGAAIANVDFVDRVFADGDRALRVANFEFQVGQRLDMRGRGGRRAQIAIGDGDELHPVLARRRSASIAFRNRGARRAAACRPTS